MLIPILFPGDYPDANANDDARIFWMLTTMLMLYFVIQLLQKTKINFSLFVRAGLSFLALKAFRLQHHALYMDKQVMDNKYETHGC